MEALHALKSAGVAVFYKSFSEIEVGEYVARRFVLITSKYGKRVKLYIDDFYCYLPERYAEILNETLIEVLNNNLVMFKYLGKDIKNRNRLMIDFDLIRNRNGEKVVIPVEQLFEENAS